jgi:phage head maturation protease
MKAACQLTDDGAAALAKLLSSGQGADIAVGFRVLIDQADNQDSRKAWVRAERAFFQTVPTGRPAIDDDAALAEAQLLLQAGNAQSVRHAALLVARRLSRHGDPNTLADRLRKKLAKSL